MKKLLKAILTALVLWLSAASASAHQPDISSFTLIEQQPGHWVLQLNAALTAFQYEVRNAYGQDSYASPEEFNQLLLDHLREKVTIRVNGEEVTLVNGAVKPGHETTVVFELSGVPEALNEVLVKNRGFENIHQRRSIFSIIKEGLDNDQFTLNEENDFQIYLSIKNNQVLLKDAPSNVYLMTLPPIAFIAGLFGFLFYRTGFRKSILAPKGLD